MKLNENNYRKRCGIEKFENEGNCENKSITKKKKGKN